MLCGWISIQDDVAAGLYSFDANEDDGEASIWRPADPRDEAEVCYSAPDRGAEYCDERVCVCLSVRDHIFGITRPIFTNFFMRVTYGRGSVLLWWRSDTLRTSGLWMTSYLLTLPPS